MKRVTRKRRRLDPDKLRSSGPLVQRVISSALLIPVVLAAVFLGGRVFSGLVAFLCIVMIFEWTRMVERAPFTARFYLLAAGATAAMMSAAAGHYEMGMGIAALSGAIAGVMALIRGLPSLWVAFTAIYIIVPCMALLWLRLDASTGMALAYILFGIVWAADIGAFFFGKFLGGPKISYALSPNKTWAGIGGGIVGGAVAAPILASLLLPLDPIIPFIFIGAGLGAASVAGDLVESAFKRKFGLKDISGIIPGHGGVLDRLDGMIFATSAMTGAIFLYMVFQKLQGF